MSPTAISQGGRAPMDTSPPLKSGNKMNSSPVKLTAKSTAARTTLPPPPEPKKDATQNQSYSQVLASESPPRTPAPNPTVHHKSGRDEQTAKSAITSAPMSIPGSPVSTHNGECIAGASTSIEDTSQMPPTKALGAGPNLDPPSPQKTSGAKVTVAKRKVPTCFLTLSRFS